MPNVPIDFCCAIAKPPLTLYILVEGHYERFGRDLVNGVIQARDRLLDSSTKELAACAWKRDLQIAKDLPPMPPIVSTGVEIGNGHSTRPPKQVPA